MQIHCNYDELVSAKELKKKFHEKNRNSHPKDQIERLAKILEYQGWRYPVKVSRLSDRITSGHGRVLAALTLGWDCPVNYQDYDDESQEYADLQADNAIASWSELELEDIEADLTAFPELDIDMLGIKGFISEPNFDPGTEEDQGQLDQKTPLVTQCPNCGECFDAHKNKPQD